MGGEGRPYVHDRVIIEEADGVRSGAIRPWIRLEVGLPGPRHVRDLERHVESTIGPHVLMVEMYRVTDFMENGLLVDAVRNSKPGESGPPCGLWPKGTAEGRVSAPFRQSNELRASQDVDIAAW